jgi:signal transduction histidine kinase
MGQGMNLLQIIGIPLLVISVLELLLGVILLRQNPRNSPVHKSVAALSFFAASFALVTAFMYVLASFGRDITPLARLNWIGWLMIPAALQFIFYLRDETSKTARTVGYILYPFWIIVLCVSVSTDLIERGNYVLLPYLDRSGPLGKPLRILGIIQLSWLMYELVRLRRRTVGLAWTKLNYFTLGMLIFAGGGTLVAGILPLLSGYFLEPGLGSYFGFPWVVLTYYAVTRHRLFDLRLAASRTIWIILASLLFAAIHIGLFTLFQPELGNALAILLSLVIIGCLFFGIMMNRAMQTWIQNIAAQNKDDLHQVLRDAIKAIATKLDLDELLGFINDSMKKSLRVESVCIFLRTEGGSYELRKGCDVHENINNAGCLDDNVVRWIVRSRTMVITEELEAERPDGESGPISRYLKEHRIEVVIPLLYKEQLLGVAVLGRKVDARPYTKIDIDLLEALSMQAAMAIENALLYDKMEDKVLERTRELENAREIAEAANRAKSDFLSTMSHELRTPLNSILGFSEVMRDGIAGPLTLDQEAYLKDIWESGRHLLRIINNLLDVSKIEAGMMTIDLDDFDLKELIEGTLALFREKALRQQIAMSAEIGADIALITADKTKIRQVLLNLLANAIKFTPSGGRVGIRAARNGAGVQIDVWDTGIGISAEDCGKLFQPFLQLDTSTTRKYEGTGLGLYLSRKLVALHGGTLWVESSPGSGSRFCFTLPWIAATGYGRDLAGNA